MEKSEDKFLKDVKLNNFREVKKFIRSTPPNEDFFSLLLNSLSFATENGDLKLINELLETITQIRKSVISDNDYKYQYEDFFYENIRIKDIETFNLLLKYDFNVNKIVHKNNKHLKNTKTLKFLLENGLNIKNAVIDHYFNNKKSIKYLLSSDFKENIINKIIEKTVDLFCEFNCLPFYSKLINHYIEEGYGELIKKKYSKMLLKYIKKPTKFYTNLFLIKNCSNINIINAKGNTALHLLLKVKTPEKLKLIEELIKAGININVRVVKEFKNDKRRYPNGLTALDLAKICNDKESEELMLKLLK
jgi:hypothetical protein